MKIVAPTALYKMKNNVSVEALQAWTSIVYLFVCLRCETELKSSIPGDSKETGFRVPNFVLSFFSWLKNLSVRARLNDFSLNHIMKFGFGKIQN